MSAYTSNLISDLLFSEKQWGGRWLGKVKAPPCLFFVPLRASWPGWQLVSLTDRRDKIWIWQLFLSVSLSVYSAFMFLCLSFHHLGETTAWPSTATKLLLSVKHEKREEEIAIWASPPFIDFCCFCFFLSKWQDPWTNIYSKNTLSQVGLFSAWYSLY